MKFFALAKLKNVVERVLGYRSKRAARLIAKSEFFNWQFYAQQVASEVTITAEAEAVQNFLNYPKNWHLKVSDSFDGGWYLANYADVARSGINPLVHYLEHGASEGRAPVHNLALPYERHLWAGLEDIMLPKLTKLIDGKEESSPLQESYALWALARWFSWKNDHYKAIEYLKQFHELKILFPSHQGPVLLLISLLIEVGCFEEASRWIELAKEKFIDSSDIYLLLSNLRFKKVPLSNEARLEDINCVYRKHNLPLIALKDKRLALSLSNLRSDDSQTCESEKTVSVVVPSYNAANFIRRALDSLLAQTWTKLEVIVVDDASSDSTADVVERWIDKKQKYFGEKKFILERNAENMGAYASRNKGMERARGDYLTVNDADDFSHPSKVELQVKELVANKAKASISYWVRCTESLYFERWRMEDALIYRNVSSLMISKGVLEDIGYWDQVRFGADTEYYERIIAYYGESAIVEVLPNVPLSFGLSDNSSLTQTKSSHLITQFAGVRKDYMSSARLWHRSNGQDLFLGKDERVRKFPISDSLLSSYQTNIAPTQLEDILRYSPHWSEGWYIRRYKPLQELNIDPVAHFIQTGIKQCFEVGPAISHSYLRNFKALTTESVLRLKSINTALCEIPPYIVGEAATNNISVLLCAHAADKTLFGAELSFLDMVKAASSNGYNVVVILPSAENKSYISAIKTYSSRIYFINDTWWQQGISFSSEVINQYKKVFSAENIALIHVNTLMQCNIYEAARLQKIPIITHVRELLSADIALTDTQCTTCSEGYKRILDNSSLVIANSKQMKADIKENVVSSLDIDSKIKVVPNVFDASELQVSNKGRQGAKLVRFGLVSSNIAKKGVLDAIRLASLLQARGVVNAEIVLIGPKTELIENMQREQQFGQHALVKYIGYISQPVEIYKNVDVVLNLSHFAESFGRTILEGMAFGKPSLCYDYGALSELVNDGETGYLVPFLDHDKLVHMAEKLVNEQEKFEKMSTNAKAKAENEYSVLAYRSAMSKIYLSLLN